MPGQAAGDAVCVPADAAQGGGGQAALPLKADEPESGMDKGRAVAVARVADAFECAERGKVVEVGSVNPPLLW